MPGAGRRFALLAEPLRDTHGSLTHVLISLRDADANRSAVLRAVIRGRAGVRSSRAGMTGPPTSAGISHEQHARAAGRAVLHQGEPPGRRRGARDRQRGTAGDQRGAGRRRTRSCRARTRSCTRSTRSSTPSTPSTRRRTPSCRSSTTTSSICSTAPTSPRCSSIAISASGSSRRGSPRSSSVIPHDVGRPLQAFSHDLAHPDPDGRYRAGAAGGRDRRERRPGTGASAAYFLRILPYRARTKSGRAHVRSSRRAAPRRRRRAHADRHLGAGAGARQVSRSSRRSSSRPTMRSSARRWTGSSPAGTHGAARLYGYSAEEAIGRHASFL